MSKLARFVGQVTAIAVWIMATGVLVVALWQIIRYLL
jgi:hypothetical protein